MGKYAIAGVENDGADQEAECRLECRPLAEGHEEEEKAAHHQHAQEGAVDGDNHHHHAAFLDELHDLADAPKTKGKEGEPDYHKQWFVFQNFLKLIIPICDIDCDVDKREHIEHMTDEEESRSKCKEDKIDTLKLQKDISY